MSIKNFLNKENLSMIWDVISDEEMFKLLSRENQNKVVQLFNNNIKGFYDNECNNTTNLMELNKKFIILILNFIKNNLTSSSQLNKIKIHEEVLPPTVSKELITYEEIQTERQSQFEKDFNKRQEEFSNAMTLPKPKIPDFKDNLNEGPITEMEKIIKEMTSQRNYEVEQISKFHKPPDNWLQSKETSIKNEKQINSEEIPNNNTNNNFNNNKLRYLQIDNDNIILNNTEKRKNVSWGSNSEILENEEIYQNKSIDNNKSIDDNIFSKLKKIPLPENIQLEINDTKIKNINDKEKINKLEKEILIINNKIDMILNILKENK
jgi:hypothetical protein